MNPYRNPEAISLAYTPDSIWRNRDVFLRGREAIIDFLQRKWAKEKGYRLRKELFAFTDNKVKNKNLKPLLLIPSPQTFFFFHLVSKEIGNRKTDES